MNPHYCVMLGLAIFLEEWIERGQGRASQWLFTDGQTTPNSCTQEIKVEVTRCKGGLYRAIRKIVNSSSFVVDPSVENSGYKLANHSTKKYATTHGRRGVLKDFMDYRARWKNKRMQDTYADTVLPWPDIKAASSLCFGGICKYKLLDSLRISDEWLAYHVCPGITQCFGMSVAAILAKPLLWASMDEEFSDYVPEGLRTQILNSLAEDYTYLNVVSGVNCIKKVLCVVSEHEGVVSFSEVDASLDMSEERATTVGGDGTMWRNVIIGKVCTIENKLANMESNHSGHYAEMKKQMEKIEKNVKRLSTMPVRRFPASSGGSGGSSASQQVQPANLCKCPKNLFILWAEYESGVGGNKPARLFTVSERGKVRFMYCRRKIIWDTIEGLVKRGLTSDAAIDQVYNECGGTNTKVNDVVSKLKAFRQNGNPVLHIHV